MLPMINDCFPLIFQQVEVVDEVCKGLEFCILSCEKKWNTIEELKAIVRSHSGSLTENPGMFSHFETPLYSRIIIKQRLKCQLFSGRNTFVCIAGDETQRVKDKIKSEKYNIVKSKWLLSALGDKQPKAKLPPFSPKDFLFKTIAMTEKLRSNYDRYDDSYTELFKSEDDLKKFLEGMKIDVRKYPAQIFVTVIILTIFLHFQDVILTSKELHEIETELSEDGQVENIFRLHTAFFYDSNSTVTDNDVEVTKFVFKTRAGNCLRNAEEVNASKTRLTHIFVRDTNFDKQELKRIVKSFESEYWSDIIVLRRQWIMDCHQANRLMNEKSYRIYMNWF